jgi:hypothetical protein
MLQDSEVLHQRLAELMLEHRELDEEIAQIMGDSSYDEFRVQRLKKRKLLLKDMMIRIHSQLIPDQPA